MLYLLKIMVVYYIYRNLMINIFIQLEIACGQCIDKWIYYFYNDLGFFFTKSKTISSADSSKSSYVKSFCEWRPVKNFKGLWAIIKSAVSSSLKIQYILSPFLIFNFCLISLGIVVNPLLLTVEVK